MRKLLMTTLMVILLAPVSLAQLDVTIGSTGCSPTTQYLPWYHYWGYSEAQYGIPASALVPIAGTDPVEIDKIGWIRCSGGTPTDYYSLNVYIDEVPDTYDLGALCTSPHGNTNLVASNKTLTETSTNVYMLTLDTPFEYTPGTALIITVCDTLGNYSSDYPYWAANSFAGNGFVRYSDTISYDCNMATNEGGNSSCQGMWMTTVFSCTFTGNTYELEMLSPEGTGGATGTVAPAPGTYLLPQGASQPIAAYPAFASDFDHWELDGSWFSDNPEEMVTMDDDHAVKAVFKPFTGLSFPVNEDFSGVPTGQLPANWSKTPATDHWAVRGSDEAGGVAPEMVLYWSPTYTGQLRLISPTIDGTTVSEILLMFKHYLYHYSTSYPYSIHVQTSIDNGATWVDRYSTSPSGDIGPETLMVELDEVAGNEFMVSFLFDGNTMGIYDWYIDDVVMIADYKGQLDGVVTNDLGPVEGAVITVVETGASVVTGPTGEYVLPHMAGIYSIKCQALGHNIVIEPDVEIIGNTVVTQDFYLTYPLASISPLSFYVEQDLGELTDEYLYLENSGNGPLDFRVGIKYLENKGSREIGNWTNVTPIATAVQWPSSCFGEGKFFVIGGLSEVSNSTIFNAIQIYDTNAGTWSVSSPMTDPRHSSVAEYYNGKVYVIGGYNTDFNASNAVQIYDIASNSWSSGATMPTGRGGASGGLIGGKIYSLGGSSTSSFPTENVAYEYDIAGNSWTTLTSGPVVSGTGLALGGGCAFDGKIYVGGHFSSSYYQFYEFDPAGGGTWTTKANIPTGLGGQTVSMLGLETEGFILAVGGGYDWSASGTTWGYDPDTNIWTNLGKPMTTAVLGGACAAGYGEIYFFGGTTGSGPVQPAPFMMNTFEYSSWLMADISSGSVDPGDTGTVTLTFDAGEVLLPGIYMAELTVSHNSGDEMPIIIPATMLVGGGGVLEGFIYDDGRGTVEDATIKIVETGQTAKSDSTGFYNFPAVPVGVFTVTCNADGFNPATETDVEIIGGDTTTLDFHLAAPALAVDPTEFSHTQGENVIETIQDALTLENTGAGTLDWSSTIEYHDRNTRNGDVLIAVHIDGNTGWYNPGPAYAAAVTAAGYNATVISSPGSASIPFPTPFTANEYGVVIVLTSENFWASPQNLTPADEAALQAYQDTGGNVMLVGQDALQSTHSSWGIATGWFKTHLGLLSVDQDIWWDQQTITLTGAAGTFAEGLNFTVNGSDAGGPFMANNFYADNLVPDTNAFVIWEGDGGGLTADVAIAFDNGATKAIFSTAELSAAASAQDFNNAIAAIMGFLGTPSLSWLETAPVFGSLLGGETQSIDLTFDSTDLEPGEYHATVTYKNVVSSAEIPVEVTLIVESIPPTETPTEGPTETPTATPTEGPTATPTPLPPDYLYIEDYYGCTDDEIEVEVKLYNETTPVDAFTMDVAFDGAMLEYIDCVAGDLDPGWIMFGCNEATPGSVRIAGFSLPPVEIPVGSDGVLAVLTFKVTCDDCEEGDSCEFAPHRLLDDIRDYGIVNGSFTFYCFGTPTPEPTEPPEPTSTPTSGPTPTPPPDYVAVGHYYGCTDDEIEVEVIIHNDTTPIDAFTFDVAFDGAMLEYIDCVEGELDPGWIMFGCNEADPGSVRIAGFSLPPVEVPVGSHGALAVLTFKVTCGGCAEGDTSEFAPHKLYDDVEYFGVINGSFTFNCLGTPTPEPTETPIPTDTPVPPTSTPTTEPPTATPTTEPPTATPTSAPPTATPTSAPPTYTPTPEPTPECDYLGTHLIISQEELFRTGDEFWLDCHVCNNTDEPMLNIATAVLLGVYGEFWFWPSWNEQQEFDFEYRDYEPGLTEIHVFEPFIWPVVVGQGLVTGLEFYSGLINAQMDNLIGDYGYLTFGYTDQ